MLSRFIYPYISLTVTIAFLAFALLLILRLIFNFSDPNPFGKVGRFSYQTEKAHRQFCLSGSEIFGELSRQHKTRADCNIVHRGRFDVFRFADNRRHFFL